MGARFSFYSVHRRPFLAVRGQKVAGDDSTELSSTGFRNYDFKCTPTIGGGDVTFERVTYHRRRFFVATLHLRAAGELPQNVNFLETRHADGVPFRQTWTRTNDVTWTQFNLVFI